MTFMTSASWLTKIIMRISITRIGLLLVLATACVGFIMGKLGEDKFLGIAMAIVTFYYVHKSQTKPPIE